MQVTKPTRKTPAETVTGSKVSVETLSATAKHLRQLNFYFLLVCAALLLAIYLPRDTKLDKATAQLNEVIRFQSDVGDEPLWEIAGAAPPEYAGQREPQVAILFQRPGAEAANPNKRNICFVYENELLQGHWLVLGKSEIDDFRDVETHQEFAQLWSALARDDAYLKIREYGPSAYFSPPGEAGVDRNQQIPIEVVTDPAEVGRLYQLAFSAEGSDLLTPTIGKWIAFDEEIGGKHYTECLQLARSMAMIGGDDAIVLPVDVEPAGLPILNRLLDRTDTQFEYLAANDYGLVHAELADWALGSRLDELGLYAMRSILDELRVTQSEKFEVFGFGVPYEFLFQYGLLVLVTVEIFFWGHLRSFRIMASRHQPAVWAPWLPLYTDRISRLLTLGSIVVFPVVVMIRLVLVAETKLSSVAIGGVGVIVACSILVEFVRHWRVRPAQVAERTPLRKAA